MSHLGAGVRPHLQRCAGYGRGAQHCSESRGGMMYHEYSETQTAEPVHLYAHPRKSPSDLLQKGFQEVKGARPWDSLGLMGTITSQIVHW